MRSESRTFKFTGSNISVAAKADQYQDVKTRKSRRDVPMVALAVPGMIGGTQQPRSAYVAGLNEAERERILGHSDERMTRHYTKVSC